MRILLYIFISISSYIFSQCDYDIGDTNNDNIINVIDIINIVNVIISDEYQYNEIMDLNQDELVNIIDITLLVNRIIDEYPLSVDINSVYFDFNSLEISWDLSSDPQFYSYSIFYNDLLNQDAILLYQTESILDTSIVLNNIELNEQNWFWVIINDTMGCELEGQKFYYELPYFEYSLDSFGNILNTDFQFEHFNSSQNCQSCHSSQYQEWTESMHAYTMHNPIFFSYKNETLQDHPDVGEKFCMQCHSPVAYLAGIETSNYSSVEEFQNSSLPSVVKEGVGCDICHTATGVSQTVFTDDSGAASAIYKLYPGENIKFGPILNPESNSYHESYYLPTYQSSQMCLPCHDLVVRDVEAEITFTEWDRIPGFSMFDGVSCQECHMPEKDDGTHDHSFIGVDIDLSIPYSDNNSYNKVADMLSSALTINFNILDDSLVDTISSGETLLIPIAIESLTGHSIPSGTSFNREAWLELIVTNNDSILYSVGYLENNISSLNYDDDLLLFKSFLLDQNNENTNSVIETHEIINNSLPAYSQRYKYYDVQIPQNIEGEINVHARMLFRPFDPQFIIQHHVEFLDNLPIYQMFEISKTIIIN